MKRAIRFALRLYPRAWRSRYQPEFESLLEQLKPGWWELADVMKGAFVMRIRGWHNARTVLATALVGCLLALAVSFSLPKKYNATAVLGLQGAPQSAQASQAMNQLAQRSLNRQSLTKVIDDLNLYRELRLRLPLEDIVETMRKNVSVAYAGASPAVEVSFVSQDQREAKAVTEALTRRMVTVSNEPDSLSKIVAIDASAPPVVIFPNHHTMAGVGLFAGLLLGGAWLLVIKFLFPAKSTT
jgi:uncharacterized protein involved in exopolysaccharide biosynthesis